MSATTQLVGRDAELHLLSSLVRSVGAGGSAAAVLEGAAGIGKSTVLRSMVALSQSTGLRVFEAAGDELDVERPFGLVGNLFDLQSAAADPTTRRLSVLLFPDVAATVGGARSRSAAPKVEEELIDLVETLCLARPVVLAFEDVHWADVASLRAIRRLTRRIGELPLLLVMSLRPTRRPEVAGVVEASLGAGGVHVTIPPLTPDAVRSLAETHVGGALGPHLCAHLAGASGNPLLVTELLRAYAHDGLLTETSTGIDVPVDVVPPSLSAAILRRVRALGETATGVLRRAAILGRTFCVRDLAALTSTGRTELLELLETAIEAGLLVAEGGRLAFHHDLVREALYRDVPEPVRREIHAQVARALAAHGADPATVATHICHHPHPRDQFDAEWLQRAVDQTVSRDPSVAAAFLAQAIALGDPGSPEMSRMAAQHVEIVMWTGDAPGCSQLAESYLRTAALASEDEALIRLCLIRSLLAQSRFADALPEVEQALGVAPDGCRARILVEGSLAYVFAGLPERAFELGHRGVTDADRHGDAFARAAASWALALTSLAVGDCEAAVAWCDRGISDASTSRDPEFSRGPYLSLAAAALVFCGQLDRAETLLREGIGLLTEAGTGWMVSIFYSSLGHVQMARGQWDDALVEYETGLAAAEETGNSAPIAGVRAAQAQILARRGDMEAAAAALADAQRLVADAGGVHYNGPDVARASALVAEKSGDADTALAILTGMWRATSSLGLTGLAVGPATDVVLIALRSGRVGEADEVVASLLDSVDGLPPALRGAALCAVGCARQDADLVERGMQQLSVGTNALARHQWAEEAALFLHDAGRGRRARELLVAAARGYEEIGAHDDLGRLHRRARTKGYRLERGSRRATALSGWEALTRSERTVAELVRQGLRNSEIGASLFVSPRTVETHLTSIYRKLGIRSRADLVRLAAERGAGDGNRTRTVSLGS